jgi:phytoene dehydrogenase-like protein
LSDESNSSLRDSARPSRVGTFSRHPNFEAHDANLNEGAINGGTSQLHQQLVFRPVPGLGRPNTFVDNLYFASASAHPGGGVHGACGANAARAALAAQRLRLPTNLPVPWRKESTAACLPPW